MFDIVSPDSTKKDNVYLIIHGFAGGTYEIKYLAERLGEKGLDTYTVSLAGHGGTKKDLTASSHVDWIRSAKNAIDKLTPTYKNISLIGFSLGGLISVHLASQPEISKVVFINTPVYFWNLKVIINDIVSGICNKQFEKIMYYQKSVAGVSIKSGADFLKILSKSKKMFKDVSKPSLILQCINDETVHYKSAKYIKEKIGNYANLHYYDGGCHQVFTVSAELRELVFDDIYKFLLPV
jgi:esterase/lipase